MMHKQNYSLCCKNACCNQNNSRCKHFVGCKNYTKDTRIRTCVTRPPKGFVQNLKDKLINLQNESLQLQFGKKPVKKKQKDYYCLMLRKINNLDKKLQKLENLFISHLNHTPNEVFNSSDNEPLCDYVDFYESVRSLVDLANRLKEDILYKQSNNYMPNRNTLYINDRIKILDSELQHLYRYLDQLQKCASEIKDAKQFFVQEDYQDLPYNYFFDDRRYSDFKGLHNTYKNKGKKSRKYNEDSYNHSPPHYEFYDADDEFPVSCQCSRCNLHASFFTAGLGNKIYPSNRFENCPGGSTAKNSDCSCELCINERKNIVFLKKTNLCVSRSISSCSCEICIGLNNKKPYDKNSNSAKVKIIKPVKKGGNEEKLLSELQISYHEMGPTKSRDEKKKQDNKQGKLSRNEENQETDLETVYYEGPTSKGFKSTAASNIKSGDSNILEKNQETITKTRFSKIISASNIKDTEEKNVVYYELTPDLNIITKRKNNVHIFNSGLEANQIKNKNTKKNKNKASSTKYGSQRNDTYKFHTTNVYLSEENPSNTFPKKVVKNKIKSHDYHVIEKLSSENGQKSNFYQAESLDKKGPAERKNNNIKESQTTEKHLHITFCKKNPGECMRTKRNEKGSPQREYKYTNTNNHSQLPHRKHGGFCHFQNSKENRKKHSNKRFSHFYAGQTEMSQSDSFETLEESDCNSSSTQYKLFFCNDPNCVEKLNSDELIMLMNNTDLKSCGENPYQLNISENVKYLKSDVCEKCTVKEKTISVTPKKSKTKNTNDKAKIIVKKEIVKCCNCKNKSNNKLSETTIIDGSFDKDKNTKELGSIQIKSSIINKGERNINSSMTSYSGRSIGENNNNKDIKNQKKSSFSTKKETDSMSSTDEDYNNKKTNSSRIENKGRPNNSFIVAQSNLDKNKSYSKILGENENSSSKALELQRFGNTININIERGSYSLNQQPGIINIQESMDESINSPTNYANTLEDKNMKLGSIAEGTIDNKIENKMNTAHNILFLKESTNELPLNTNNATANNPINISIQSKTETISPRNKSISALDLAKNSEKNVMTVKSAVFTMSVSNDKYSSKVKSGMKSQPNNPTEVLIYAAPVKSGMADEKDGKRQSKKDITNMKKEISLDQINGKNPGSVLDEKKNPPYIYETGQDVISKTQSVLKKTIVKPRGSMTRLKRSRLKFSKHFGSSLSKVSSVNSVALYQAKSFPDDDFPSKKSSVFNPGRRISKLSKRRHNVYPRISSLKENSLSGIIKPQVKIVVQENYKNEFKIPSNSSNSRYKVASISNYLSSTVESESSYSTLNWGRVANKLKEDDNYYNDIA